MPTVRRIGASSLVPLVSCLLAVALLATAGCARSAGDGRSDGGAGASGTSEPGYKVTVAGDSIALGFGGELRSVVPADMVVRNIGESGTGLARPDTFDWPTRIQKLAREFPPRVLVFSVGSNDAQDLQDVSGATVARVADPAAWDAEYLRRLGAVFDSFEGTGTTIVWVGQGRPKDPRVGATNRHIHQLATNAASTRPWVRVEDFAALLGSGDAVPDRCLMPDGLHLTAACLHEAGEKLVPALPK